MINTAVNTDRSLPVLDISEFARNEASPGAERFVKELREACHSAGFLYLVGHGVPDSISAYLLSAAREFFALSLEDRMEIAMDNSPYFRGYTPFKGERTNGQADLRDEIDFGPERECVATPLHPWERLVGPNQFPTMVPSLKPAVLAWQREMDRLGRRLLRAVAKALGQSPEILEHWVNPTAEHTIKLVRYAPRTIDGGDQGVGMHRDFGLLTFVLQDEVGGLEVEHPGGWMGVMPLPGAFVVNLGEMLQVLTNGYFKATVHRVVSPPSGVERYSCIYFFNPRLDATLPCLNLPPELTAEAPGGDSDDPSNPIFATYGENILKVRLRAHPTTAAIHHADLL